MRLRHKIYYLFIVILFFSSSIPAAKAQEAAVYRSSASEFAKALELFQKEKFASARIECL
jgi:hypothetical protein